MNVGNLLNTKRFNLPNILGELGSTQISKQRHAPKIKNIKVSIAINSIYQIMGCGAQKQQSQGLSQKIRQQALEIFRKIDVNNSGSIDKDETQKFWKTNFAKVNTQALFNAVDFDKSGQISEDEWMAFWEIVKKSGYTDSEIQEELNNLNEGKAWVQFRKVDEFVRKDQQRKKSLVQQMVQQQRKSIQQ